MPIDQEIYSWGMGVSVLVFSLLVLIANIFFCLSLYSAMKKVPEKQRSFPAWFAWMIAIPFLHLIFAWIMIPFGIPSSFKRHCQGNQAAMAKAKGLFGVGLALVILMSLSILPFINIATGAATLVLYIIYWVKIVKFKKQFLVV